MSENKKENHRANRIIYVIFSFFVAALLTFKYFSSQEGTAGTLADSDCYMHLLRVLELCDNGKWFDPVITRSNAPYGEPLHWTRPFDVLLMAGANVFSIFTDFGTALFWWGIVISPVILCLSLIAMNWATREILGEDGSLLIGFVVSFQLIVLVCCQAGRPDHHSLLLLLYIISFGLMLRIILKPLDKRACYLGGAVAALSLWVSIESLVGIFVILVTLGLIWILEDGDLLRKSFHFSISAFIFISLSLALEKSWNTILQVEYDRISVVHLSIFGFITALWLFFLINAHKTNFVKNRKCRLYFGFLGAVLLAAAILVCFPKFYNGPFANVDPRIMSVWFSKISEVQPLVSSNHLPLSMQTLGSSMMCIIFLTYAKIRDYEFTRSRSYKYICLSLAVFFGISLYQVRWAMYTQILNAIIITKIIIMLLKKVDTKKLILVRATEKALIVIFFSTIFLVVGVFIDTVFVPREVKGRNDVPIIGLCRFFNETESLQNKKLRILTSPDFGAEILYRTKCEVIATANRYESGITDTYDIMTARADEKAFELIEKRKINMILLCPESSEGSFYSSQDAVSTFYKRMLENKLPTWLKKIEFPQGLSSCMLFEVPVTW